MLFVTLFSSEDGRLNLCCHHQQTSLHLELCIMLLKFVRDAPMGPVLRLLILVLMRLSPAEALPTATDKTIAEQSALPDETLVDYVTEKLMNNRNAVGTFWQITDIHWDQQYSINGDDSKMCHSEFSLPAHENGIYGNYLCDSPWPLVRSAIRAMKQLQGTPDFILWTGDNVPHTNDPEPSFSVIFETLSNITGELRTTFQDSIPILPVLGNHDAYPKDDFPVAGEEFYGLYLTRGGWSAVLTPDAQADFKKGGFYSYELAADLTILVVNTNLYYANNILGVNASDPCGQFAWMREMLQKARNEAYKVIVAAHAPPGYFERFAVIPFFNATYNDAYVDLLNEFGDVIMAQIYGHEHTDSFKIFSKDDDNFQSVAFLAPSLTPWYPAVVPGGTAVNPSLRLYHYNKSTLLDYTQYHLNLTQANGNNTSQRVSGMIPAMDNAALGSNLELGLGLDSKWEKYYQAREVYGLDALDVNSMALLYARLSSDDELFQKYYLMNSAGYNNGRCDQQCKKNHLCAIANIKIRDLNLCMGYSGTQNGNPLTASDVPVDNPSVTHKDVSPVNADGNSSYTVVVLISLSMALTVMMTVTLGMLLVMMAKERNRILGKERSIQVADLTWVRRQQGYKPF